MILALVIGSLRGGGAERIMATLASAWSKRGITVNLITISAKEEGEYVVDAAVTRIALGLKKNSQHWWQGLSNNIRRTRALRAALRSVGAEVIVSFMPSANVLSVFATRRFNRAAIVAERTSPTNQELNIVWRSLRRYAYKRAAAIVVQTKRSAPWFEKRAPNVPVRIIPNPISIDSAGMPDEIAQSVLDACSEQKFLLAVGRLHPVKGFDLLLDAFGRVSGEYPEWRLVILGEGPERERIESQAHESLAGRVLLPGFSNTPQVLMKKASLFVMPSRFEGFPNALLEAMACGLPCISFDCSTGPAELIEDNVNGLLLEPEDVPGLSRALSRAMKDDAMRERLGIEARKVLTRFNLESILAKWERLFDEVIIGQDPALRSRSLMGSIRAARK